MSDEKRLDGLSNIDPEWFAKKAEQEGDLEIGCGRSLTHTVNLTPEQVSVLERLVNPVAADLRSRIAALELRLAEAERVISGLGKLSTHGSACAYRFGHDCDCGREDLLRAARAWKEGK